MTDRRTVLITGADGQVGTELRRCHWPSSWDVVAVGRSALDLGDVDAITAMLASRNWSAVVNAAAYTQVDKAESDLVAAWTLNALAPAALAASCAVADIPLVHISTDYVFPGNKQEPWAAGDPTGPLNVYGASKLGGELAIRTAGVRHAIVRTSWVVSAHGQNFVKTMLRLARDRNSLRVVDDQSGSPTGAADLAAALMRIAVQLAEDPKAPSGTCHFSNDGRTSWAAFAAEIFRQSAARGGPSAEVEGIATSEYPTPARRPASSLLDTRDIQLAYGIRPRPWPEALSDILDELIGEPK